MLGKKGISPLIAAVILIAFVIAVAGIASTFFTGFTKETKADVESKAGTIVDCAVATIEMDSDTVGLNESEGSFSLVVSNTGSEDLSGLKIIFFNSTYAGTCNATPTSISIGQTATLVNDTYCASDMPTASVTKVRITTSTCAGVKAEIQTEDSGTTWKVTA